VASTARKSRTDVRRQATQRRHDGASPFRCWRCGKALELAKGALKCSACEAAHRPRRGVVDLLPPGPDPGRDVFDTWYGWLYDAGVNRRELAIPGGFVMWGADVSRFYRISDAAIACEPGEIVLDVPTGGGVTFAGGAPHTSGLLVGVDLSLAMLERAARRRRDAGLSHDHVLLARGDATRLPFFEGSIDRICCFNSLHCIPHQAAVLKEFRRVLKQGGELIGTTLVEDAPLPWRLNVELARLGGFFVPPESRRLERQARAAGFSRWSTEQSGALLYFRGE
jgi:SAM-dependent methyltransferase